MEHVAIIVYEDDGKTPHKNTFASITDFLEYAENSKFLKEKLFDYVSKKIYEFNVRQNDE